MASARAAGGGSLGSDTQANAGRAGAVVGGVVRRHGAVEFRGLSSAYNDASRSEAARGDVRRRLRRSSVAASAPCDRPRTLCRLAACAVASGGSAGVGSVSGRPSRARVGERKC